MSLDAYREASRPIMKVMRRYSSIFERGGLDEAYLDITEHWYALSPHFRLIPVAGFEWSPERGGEGGDAL